MPNEKDLNKVLERIYLIIEIIKVKLMVGCGKVTNDNVLYNMRTIIGNALKPLLVRELSDIKIDVYMKGDTVHIRPMNLFTGLALMGYYVPTEELNGKDSWETDNFTMKMINDEVTVYPKTQLKVTNLEVINGRDKEKSVHKI